MTGWSGRFCRRIRREGFFWLYSWQPPEQEPWTIATPPESVEIYCLKCRTKTGSRDVEQVIMKNGRSALRAVCSVCGAGKYRIGSDRRTWASATGSFARSGHRGNSDGAWEVEKSWRRLGCSSNPDPTGMPVLWDGESRRNSRIVPERVPSAPWGQVAPALSYQRTPV